MIIIGLTGGIASGKSTVSAGLEILGGRDLYVIDMDKISRQVVEPGSEGLGAVIESFGKDYLHNNGTLNREKLSATVFAEPEARHRLDTILEPFVVRVMEDLIEASRTRWQRKVVILDSALLYEAGWDSYCNFTIVVDADPEQQIERLMARNGYDRERAQQRLAAQMSAEERLSHKPTWILNNRGSQEELAAQINLIWDGIKMLMRVRSMENV